MNYYYIVTRDQYNQHSSNLDHLPAWNLAGDECVIEVSSSYVISNYLHQFTDSGAVNLFRYSNTEYLNWMTQDERDGILD
jgi:hypothetical protein